MDESQKSHEVSNGRPAAERMPEILVHAKHRRRSNAPLKHSRVTVEKLRRPAKGFAVLASGAFAVMAVVGPYSVGATAASAAPVIKHVGSKSATKAAAATTDDQSDDEQQVSVADSGEDVDLSRDEASAKAPATDDDSDETTSTPSSGSPKAYAKAQIKKRGWADSNYTCLVKLWKRESGWRVNAKNSSGAYGIPQALPGSKMASAGSDWKTNAETQIDWGLGYISGRYGTPCSAWAHSQSTGWY